MFPIMLTSDPSPQVHASVHYMTFCNIALFFPVCPAPRGPHKRIIGLKTTLF
jgi:hypothetical protein